MLRVRPPVPIHVRRNPLASEKHEPELASPRSAAARAGSAQVIGGFGHDATLPVIRSVAPRQLPLILAQVAEPLQFRAWAG